MPDLIELPDPYIGLAIQESLKAVEAGIERKRAIARQDFPAMTAANRRAASHRAASGCALRALSHVARTSGWSVEP